MICVGPSLDALLKPWMNIIQWATSCPIATSPLFATALLATAWVPPAPVLVPVAGAPHAAMVAV